MTKKLRLHFISLGTLAVVIVIVAVISMINVRNFMETRSDIYNILDFIIANDDTLQPNPEKKRDFNYPEELAYQNRYFSVTFSEKGDLKQINLDHIATVSEEDAVSYAKKSMTDSGSRDFFILQQTCYAYEKLQAENGDVTMVFFDCTSYFESAYRFLHFSIIYGFICLIMFVLIIAFFSKRAIEPVVKNIDKQKQFITNAGHELKTPLAIISANTELLEMLNGKNEWTESTMKQVKRLTVLIQNLITISRMNEQSDLTLTDVNLSSLIDDVVPSFKLMAMQQFKDIKTDCAPELMVKGDEASIQELLNILLDNAVKYCDDEGIIDVTANTKGRSVRLMISNSYLKGEGVDYSRFMDRFYRADPSRNEKKGYGIGLSMAEALCEQMRGKLQISYRGGMISFTAVLQKA